MSIVIDVSNNNTISPDALRASKAVALICKATEGMSFTDITYPAHRQIAKEVGIPFGGYLFLHPNSPGNEAEFFLNYAQPRPGDIQPAVDSEALAAGGARQAAQRTLACLHELSGHGYAPLLYSSTSMLEAMFQHEPALTGYRIWQAQYAAQRAQLGHGAIVCLWQFSQTYPVQGRRYDASLLYPALDTLLIPKPVSRPLPHGV